MNATTTTARLARLLAVPALIFGLAACNNPVEHEEHPEGLVILDASGNEVSRYMVGVGTATSELNVTVDQPATFTVQVVSEDGDVIEIDGDELVLSVGQGQAGFTASITDVDQLVITAGFPDTGNLVITLFHDDHPEFDATFEVVAS